MMKLLVILLCIEENEFFKNLPTQSLDGETKNSHWAFGYKDHYIWISTILVPWIRS